MKILITGGAGNVGSSLANSLASAEFGNLEIIVADNLRTGKLSNIDLSLANLKFVHCDVNEFNELSVLMTQNSFDVVFHYAALVGVMRTLENPMSVYRDIEGLHNILRLSGLTKVKRLYFSSSSEVYGEPIEIPQVEEFTPLNAKLPYALVKSLGESMVKNYAKLYGFDYTIFRFFNTYGPNQSSDFVIAKFIGSALANKPIYIFGDGLQTRTFCYVKDNVDFTINTLLKNQALNETINVGNNQEITIVELAKMIVKLSNSRSPIIHLDPLKEGDMLRRCPDNSKMLKLYKRELITLEDGLLKLLNRPVV
jgi:UDP-glucose 4-epimerase